MSKETIDKWLIHESNGKQLLTGLINKKEITAQIISVNTEMHLVKLQEDGIENIYHLGIVDPDYQKFCKENNIDPWSINYSESNYSDQE